MIHELASQEQPVHFTQITQALASRTEEQVQDEDNNYPIPPILNSNNDLYEVYGEEKEEDDDQR